MATATTTTAKTSQSTTGAAATQQTGPPASSRSLMPLWLGLASGLMFWAALPPIDLWPLGWLAMTPLVLLVRDPALPGRRPYLQLWLAGCAFWLATLYWLTLPHPATAVGWLALSMYLACYTPVFVGLTRVAVHCWHVSTVIAAPVVYMGLELARGHLLTGFLMAVLGHTQYRQLAIIQISDLGGAYAVSFLLVAVAACVARMIPWAGQRGALWPVVPLVALPLAAWGYGQWRLATPEEKAGPTVALIQGSVDITMKTDPTQTQKIFDEYFDLSLSAHKQNPDLDLIVWPETMFRYPWFTFSSDFRPPAGADWTPDQAEGMSRQAVAQAVQSLGAPALLGVDSVHQTPDRTDRYNSAMFFDEKGHMLARYHKCHLVMFGEYVPLAKQLPLLYRLTPLPGGLDAGDGPTCCEIHGVRYAPNICFETTSPHLIRSQVLTLREQGEEPDVLVNLTNDGWFWGSTELDLHLACGVFRAIECRKPLLAAANTGLSFWIDANGQIRAEGGRRQSEFLIAHPNIESRSSWYLEHGDVPAGACLAGCIGLAASGLRGRRREKSVVA